MEQFNNKVDWTPRRTYVAAGLIAATLSVGILIGTVVSGRVSAMKSFSFARGAEAAPLALPDPIPSSNSFAAIVNRVEPAVVNIATTQVVDRKSAKRHGGDQDDPSEDFFFHFFDGKPDAGPRAERSLGSGVIVDKTGFILTNNHVVEQATKIQVQLNGDTTKYTAKVVGVDEETDLAVIKIDTGKELAFCEAGQFRRRAGGRLGAGDRQSVWTASHGDRGHHQRQGSRGTSGSSSSASCRPTRRSIPAIPAVRWWIWLVR